MSDSYVLHLNDANFEEEVLNFSGVVLVDFWAPWCGPCRMMAPIIEKLAERYKDNPQVKIAKLDIEEAGQTAGVFQIMSIPTLTVFVKGEQIDMAAGVQPMQYLEKMIEKGLKA